MQVSRTVDGVCNAAHATSSSETAREIFFDEAHDGLHALAAEVTDVDRSIAAELLPAKENVERLLDGDTPPEQLRLALRFLRQASTDAVLAISDTEPERCDA